MDNKKVLIGIGVVVLVVLGYRQWKSNSGASALHIYTSNDSTGDTVVVDDIADGTQGDGRTKDPMFDAPVDFKKSSRVPLSNDF